MVEDGLSDHQISVHLNLAMLLSLSLSVLSIDSEMGNQAQLSKPEDFFVERRLETLGVLVFLLMHPLMGVQGRKCRLDFQPIHCSM